MRGINERLRWCMAQTKGIRIIKPSDNLVKAYFGKSQNALKAMEVNANAVSPNGPYLLLTTLDTLPSMRSCQNWE